MTNQEIISNEMKWLEELIQNRISNYFQNDIELLEDKREFSIDGTYYGEFIKKNALTMDEQKVLALALATEIAPEVLDIFLTKNKLYDLPFTEFGGVSEKSSVGFLPTVQTALFLLSGSNREKYLNMLKIFDINSTLQRKEILIINKNKINLIHQKLVLSESSLNFILYGIESSYEFSSTFPASLLKTNYNWDDLVLSDYTINHLEELDIWLKYSDILLNKWSMNKHMGCGYKALFYGSSGTGKTLTVSLLGKKFNKPVYRINLSQIVSKYIGETEKNLEKVFQIAEDKDWILFFDEADSLFSKRTGISSSNDKYANQETAYLLQRVEECSNMIILASNLKDNFDDAFLRRFQSIIYFPLPEASERLKLWQNAFSQQANLSEINLKEISQKYELSGANIVNIVRFSSLMAIKRDSNIIKKEDIIIGIRREKYKEGKII